MNSRMTILAVLMCLALVAPLMVRASGPSGQAIYANARFGYTIEYPRALLTPHEDSDNGDGAFFKSTREHVDIRVYGSFIIEGINDTSLKLANDAEQPCSNHLASYR